MSEYPDTPRSKIKRVPERALYDRETVHAILDAALVCHVGFEVEGQPYVIPSLHARRGDALLLHGATSSRLMRHVAAGARLCITVTLLDGLVLARSVFEHSLNYRSVVVFGRGALLEENGEKLEALRAFTERLIPGRWEDARQPNEKELKATAIAAVAIEEASAKVRTGGPADEAADLELPVWAGTLPLRTAAGELEAAEDLSPGLAIPQYLTELRARYA